MSKTASLVFTHMGLVNPTSLIYIENNKIDTVVLFGDGSEEAYQHIRNFDRGILGDYVTTIGIGKTPLYEMRVISPDGTLSKPHYMYTDEVKRKWVCAKVCAPYIHLSVSDITSQSGTRVQLDRYQTELVCYVAYQFWTMLRVAEDRLAFPAMVIDAMTRWTYSLTPRTIDVIALRKETGLSSLDYHSMTDLLSVTVGGEIFTVKLSVLNNFYGDYILPFFNSIFGRRLNIAASVKGVIGHPSELTMMSYGQLGRVVEDLMIYAKERKITADTPMSADDLFAFAKKVRIDDESCVWLSPLQTMANLADFYYADIVRTPLDDTEDDDTFNNSAQDVDYIPSSYRSNPVSVPLHLS